MRSTPRFKTFYVKIPWDVSDIRKSANFVQWCMSPRAIINFDSDGRRVFVYIMTLTEFQRKY